MNGLEVPGQFYMYIFQQLEDRSNTAQNDPENLLYSFHAMENRISQHFFSLFGKVPEGFYKGWVLDCDSRKT